VWITNVTRTGGVLVRSILSGLLAALFVATWAGAALSSAEAQAATDGQAFAAMCSDLQALDGQDGIRLGLVVADLSSGERCEVRADESFRSASLYKLVVLAEAERQIAAGTLSLDDAILIEPRHAIDDPPELRPAFTSERSVRESIRRMIQSSSNADAQALRERLGLASVDALPAAIGMESTRLGEEFVTSPEDIATFFTLIYGGDLVDRTSSAAMVQLLSGQLLTDLIPESLPAETVVAHKTGTLADFLHDAGIVFAPGGDYVVVAMSEHPFIEGAAADLLREVSRRAYQTYALAPGSEPLVSPELERAETDPGIVAAVIAGFTAGQAASEGAAAADLGGQVAPGALMGSDSGSEVIGPADSGFGLPGISGVGVREAALGGIALLGLLTLLGVFSYGLRLRPGWGAVYNRGAVNAVAGGGERNAPMRLGIRKNDQDDMYTDDEVGMVPASASITEIEAQPAMPSPRLERMAAFFSSQQHLIESIREQHEDEMQPLNALLARQSYTQARLLANLENRLRPLNEYADGEEANLDALEQRMLEQGPDFIQRSFSEYLETQRRRISETRDQIDEQRLPLLAYGEEQRDAVEVALSRFDADVEALELNLAEQRKLLMRMLDAMRSDSFVAVKRFLEAREFTMSDLADSGVTDPGQIGKSAQNLRDAVDAMSSQSVHIQSVLEATDTADERLVKSAPGGGPYALPELPSFANALAELEAVEAEEAVAGA